MPPEHAHNETHAKSVCKIRLNGLFSKMIKRDLSGNDGVSHYRVWIAIGLAFIFTGLIIVDDDALSAQSEKLPPIIVPTPGLKPSDAPEAYGPDTLYQKINGQAEFYLAAGFVSLKSQWYEAVEDVETMIEVNLYHMGNLLNAFSVFSLQRRDDAQPIDLTQFAYQTESSIYLVHGPHYVEMLATEPLGPRISILTSLAEQLVNDTPVEKEDIPQLALFPLENQVKGSASMISTNAFGFDLLDNVFTTAYAVDDGRVTAYISKRKTPAEAKELAKGLHTYFKSFGGKEIEANISIGGTHMIEIMGTFDLMFAMGDYLAGVHEAPTPKQAEKIAQILIESLQEKLK
jgi:hypothetical protein